EKMQQNFDRIVTRIDRRSQCLPVRFRGADELCLRSIVCNPSVKDSYLKTEQAQIRNQKNEKRDVSATYPHQSHSPFCLPEQLRATATPALWQQVQFNCGGWQLNPNYLSRARHDPFHGFTHLVAAFIQQHIREGSVDAL